ncbi:FMN-binding negative transcriptional regulator [Alcaligenaceae bacterium]|nr:FMN-binding negative transcriptional regulator [Alcaligenaceae bacterium]
MYLPSHFEVNDPKALEDLISKHPLGVLITQGQQGLSANHLPFELDSKQGVNTLRAHVARNNPLWQEIADADDVLIVFRADDAYISPNWYPSKHETHQLVPTWNYRVVHVHGRIFVRDDEKYVRGVVARLTRKHESTENKPWRMTDSAPDYIDSMLESIVGIEIEVTRMVGKFKLSQNRKADDRISAANTLIQKGEVTLGQAMLDTSDA